MSVHELVMEIYYAGAVIDSSKREDLESALRSAVIREASVATLTVTDHASGQYGSSQIYHWNDIANIVAGTYDLIPHKATP